MVWYPKVQQDGPMKQDLPSPFRHHLFVCHGAQCAQKGPDLTGERSSLKDTLKTKFKNRGLKGVVRVTQSGCLGQCDHAPNIMDYPSGTWYKEVNSENLHDIERDVLARLKKEDL